MNDPIDVLILKKISGQELSDSEKQVFSAWMESSPKNRKVFLQTKIALTNNNQSTIDQYRNDVWSEIGHASIEKNKSQYWNILRWAAIFLLVSIVVLQLFNMGSTSNGQKESITYVEKISLPGQKITTVLPDGTTVKLNSGSKLITPSQFNGDVREVELIGEAFFDVQRDINKPFIIKANGLNIEVLGTSFNVKAYVDDDQNSVFVQSGKVRVHSASSDQSVDLIVDQMVAMDGIGQLSRVQSFDAAVAFGWMNKQLVFKNTPFREVLIKTERWFDVKIIVDRSTIPEGDFTGTFTNTTVREVLSSLTKAYQLNYSINDNEVTIY